MTEQNSKQEHLGELSRDFAVFLPAISNFYNTFISKQRVSEGKHIPAERIPAYWPAYHRIYILKTNIVEER